MESKNIKTATIKSITPNGNWSNGQQTFNKYKVELNNGDMPDFSAIGEFKRQIGDTIHYTLSDKNYGKLVTPPPNAQQATQPSTSITMTQQESIARSVGINKAVDLVGSQAWMNCSSNEEKDQLLKETVYIAKLLYKECITKPQ